MPAYKLTYFPLRCRGEQIRYVFAVAGVEFEDFRVDFFNDWAEHKPKMPFRQMPVLEVDGKQLSQSYAILRYLANEYGLAGNNKWEMAEADQFSGAIEDVFLPAIVICFERDETRKAEALKKFKEEKAPNVLQVFEAALAKSSSGYLVDSGLTYVDLSFLSLIEFIEDGLKEDGKNILSAYPNIQKHRQKIQALPKIAAWIMKRPEDKF